MAKLVIFDLDGVLLDSSDIHYDALNQSLAENGAPVISRHDHEHMYNGLSTRTKLARMTGVDVESVYRRKQELTRIAMQRVHVCPRLQNALIALKSQGYIVMCASNCIRETVYLVLKNLGILEFFDNVLSNEDVENPKPSPDIYLKCMDIARTTNAVIFEDSDVGLQAAYASNAKVCRVIHPSHLTLDFILAQL